MRKLAFVLLLLFGFTLAACGGSAAGTTPTATSAPPEPTATTAPAATPTTSGAPAITMGAFSFTHNSVTIKAGQSVTFDDPTDTGGVHEIVTGTTGKFTAANGAPTEFASASGVSFAPGDSKTIKFTTAGTFSFTCTIHPSMHATVIVTA